MPLYRCAACGSPNVVTDHQADGVDYNYMKGAVGTVVLGAGGAAAGIESKQQKVYKCPDCGMTLTYPMDAELKFLIDAGVMSSNARKSISWKGVHLNWSTLKSHYKNIEFGTADREIAEKETQSKNAVLSLATATKDEFDQAVDTVANYNKRIVYRHQDDRFSNDHPMTLAEYLSMESATKLVIENLPKYLPPPLPMEYRGLSKDNIAALFSFYVIERLKEVNDVQNALIIPSYGIDFFPFPSEPHAKVIVALVGGDPFIKSWLELYDDAMGIDAEKQSPFVVETMTVSEAEIRLRRCEWVIKNLDYSSPYYISVSLYKDKGIGRALENDDDYAALTVPRFLIKDGKLGYWDATFDHEAADEMEDEDGFNRVIERFLATHPEANAALDDRITQYFEEKEHSNQERAQFERLREESEMASARTNTLKAKISINQKEIEKLENKLFGKEKAKARIAELTEFNNKLQQEINEANQTIKHYNDASKKAYAAKPTHQNVFYSRLLSEWNGLIDWRWVEEADTSPAMSKSLTEEVKTAEPDNQAASSPKPSAYADQLRELKALLDEGILTQEEFDAKKKQILGL